MIEIIVSGVSIGISVVNCNGTAGIWVQYFRENRRVLNLVRTGEWGQIDFFNRTIRLLKFLKVIFNPGYLTFFPDYFYHFHQV